MHRLLISCATSALLLACTSDPSDPGGSATGGADPGTGGTSTTGGTAAGSTATGGDQGAAGAATTGGGGTGGIGGFVMADCRLPAVGTSGVPRPAGDPGGLLVLDWGGFKGAVSYTFDDGNSSQIAHYDELNALGVPMTFYLVTGKSTATDAIWTQAVADGHELGNHTVNHPQTGSDAELDDATAFLQEHYGVRPWTMAAPYGDSSYQALAETRFMINRGVANALIKPNGTSNPFNLPCYIPPAGALASDFNAQIDATESGGGWRVVLVHGFTGGTDGAYLPVDIAEFVAGVTHAKELGDLWLDTVENVGAYWIAQKLLTGVTPTSAGSSQLYTWTLPENFPPGKCLRVTVTGGTLSQGGTALTWNDAGFYEIALDAGSLTLDP